jgi:predicted dehydrogenase
VSDTTIRVRVWSEHTAPRAVFPDDINGAVAAALREDPGLQVSTAELVDPDNGVPQAELAQTDVLVWWGHLLHRNVPDAAVDRIVARVRDGGMGFVALHSTRCASIRMWAACQRRSAHCYRPAALTLRWLLSLSTRSGATSGSVYQGTEGLARTRVIDACYQSAGEGREVAVVTDHL